MSDPTYSIYKQSFIIFRASDNLKILFPCALYEEYCDEKLIERERNCRGESDSTFPDRQRTLELHRVYICIPGARLGTLVIVKRGNRVSV